mgnify:CR=1 FL=1
MELSIIYPTHKDMLKVVWIEIETPKGSFVIEKGHAPMIISLSEDKQITYQTNAGPQYSKKIAGGIAHITRSGVSIFVDQ